MRTISEQLISYLYYFSWIAELFRDNLSRQQKLKEVTQASSTQGNRGTRMGQSEYCCYSGSEIELTTNAAQMGPWIM